MVVHGIWDAGVDMLHYIFLNRELDNLYFTKDS